jgi:hypothetical protein
MANILPWMILKMEKSGMRLARNSKANYATTAITRARMHCQTESYWWIHSISQTK